MAKTNSAYSILVDVELDLSNIDKQLKDKQKGIKFNIDGSDVDNANGSFKKLRNTIEDTNLTFNVANQIFRDTIDVIKSMASEVFALDESLTEFKKVSDLSGSGLDSYVAKLSNMGSEVARTTSEMLDATTEFRKNGFNDADAAQLGQIAAMYQNVSDETISAGDSASFIISQLVAFGDSLSGFSSEADKAAHVIDAVNEVANNFAVSSGQIATNLGNMSAVMSQTGASFEESLGMLTAITEVTRNASKASRGNKSLSV